MRLLSRRDAFAGAATLAALRAASGAPPAGKPKQLCGTVSGSGGGTPPPTGPVCTPTTVPMQMVAFIGPLGGTNNGNGAMWPSTAIPYFLHSSWHCCPNGGVLEASTDFTIRPPFFELEVKTAPAIPNSACELILSTGIAGTTFFDAHYQLPVLAYCNLLISVDGINRVVQVYCNDVAAPLMSGGFTGSGMMNSAYDPYWGHVIDVGNFFGSATVNPALGYIWENAMPSFVDLSVVANRRKFINADLSVVDVGVNGQGPFGAIPPIYMIGKTNPNDFLTNYGFGGSSTLGPDITLGWQPAGQCDCPS